MRDRLCRSIGVVASFVILGFFLRENKAAPVEYDTSLNEKRKMVQQKAQEQISSEVKNHLKYFAMMQNDSPVHQHARYTLLAGDLPPGKRLLTVGISSSQRTRGSHLLDTLQSLFQASSEQDLEYMLVLVLLSDTDPRWLYQTVDTISDSFMPHLEVGRLLIVHGLLGGSLSKNRSHTSPCGEVYSKQKTNFALLMNLAYNLSDYFLLLEDNVRCAPRFFFDIYWALSAWGQLSWVILDFSSMKISGKVFHTRDLSLLTSFLLLFPKDTPTHLLLFEFHLLLSQNVPIRFSSSIFYNTASFPESEDTCFPVEQDKVFGEPDNPTATVYSDMLPFWNTIPQYAYILNNDCFWALTPLKGNYLLVLLDKPHKVTRVAVLTGSSKERMNHIQHGQLLLGYIPMEYPRRCAHYSLVGPLVRGQMDQMVFYEEDSVKEISCIKLLVSESHDSSVKIIQIRVWTELEEEEN